eukprot:scaffold365712_cov64-Attheya_sp.AAC.2
MPAPHKATAPNPGSHVLFTGQHVPLATRITKPFHGGQPFEGIITQYADPLTEYYLAKYNDGDSPAELTDCQKYLSVPTDLVSPTSTIQGSVSVTDPDQDITGNPGEIFATEPCSGEKPLSFRGDPNAFRGAAPK